MGYERRFDEVPRLEKIVARSVLASDTKGVGYPVEKPNASPQSLLEGSKKLPRAVIVLGWVSFFTDASADMIYPLVPAFLISLGGGATVLGVLEAAAEAVSAVIKYWAGGRADKSGKPKRLVVLGYGLSAFARPLYALATIPLHVVFVRVGDRVGKGLRGPPRDAMLAASVDAASRGHAFGFHRMMDNFGGVAGPLFAFVALRLVELPLRTVFVVSIVPGLISVLIAQVFLKDMNLRAAPPKADVAKSAVIAKDGSGEGEVAKSAVIAKDGSGEDDVAKSGITAKDGDDGTSVVPRMPWRFFLATAVFTLAASGDLFLMQRLTNLGLSVALVPIAWVSLQLLKGLFNVPGGRASDRFGRRRVLALAWLIYAATYVGFGFVTSPWLAWVLIAPYALHYGFAEGGQRALLTDLVPPSIRGRAFGTQLALEGIFVIPANIGFGLLSDHFGPRIAFGAAAACAALAAVLLMVLVPANSPAPQKA